MYTQTEAVYLLTENIEFENNAPALCRIDWCIVNGNCNYQFLFRHSPKLHCCTLGKILCDNFCCLVDLNKQQSQDKNLTSKPG